LIRDLRAADAAMMADEQLAAGRFTPSYLDVQWLPKPLLISVANR
jgi:hypothetical protein